MKTRSFLLLLALLFASQLVAGNKAAAQVVVRGGYYAPRAYYGPRNYYPPRPAVVYAVPPPPVVVVPAPYYAPRVYYAPRPYYGPRGRGYHARRW